MLKINLNLLKEKSLNNLIKKLSHPNNPPCSFIIIKISRAFCMYHQISSHNYKTRNRDLLKNHPILINDLDNDFTYFMIDNNCGQVKHLYLIKNSGYLVMIDSSLKKIPKQSSQSNLDYFYYFTKQLEANLKLKE